MTRVARRRRRSVTATEPDGTAPPRQHRAGSPHPTEPPPWVPDRHAALVAVAVLAGLATTVLSERFAPKTSAFIEMSMIGASALGAGLAIITAVWLRRGRPGEVSRGLLGLACCAWGLGQLVIAQDALRDGRSFGIGDLLGTLAVPLSMLAVAKMPRRSRTARPALRLGLDSLLLALSLLLVVWQNVLLPAVPDRTAIGVNALMAAAMAFFDLLVASLTSLLWLRERRNGELAVALGCALQAAADVHVLPIALHGGLVSPLSNRLWCVAWPVIAYGVIRLRIGPSPDALETALEDLGESRTTTVATLVGIGALTSLLVSPSGHPLSSVAVAVLGSLALLLAGRELLAHRIRNRLVTQLGEETLRDILTGLPNRWALTARIRTLDRQDPWVLLTVDLDGFKEINDLLGDEAGDRLLRAVADVLTRELPARGMVARLGGDQFGLLAPGGVAEGERLAQRMARAVRACPDHRIGLPLTVGIGIGRVRPDDAVADDEIAPAGDGGNPTSPHLPPTPALYLPPASEQSSPWGQRIPALLDRRHDRLVALTESATALRAAKSLGRDRIAAYPGEVERAQQRRLVVEWRLRQALTEGLLSMHAQPLVDLASGAIRGFESLARWTDDVLGPVSPAEFVPVAEQAGLVNSLGDFALRFTLDEARALGVFELGLEVGVNVSPIQLRLPRFAAMVVEVIQERRLPVEQVVLEVTEAILVDEDDPAAATLAELAAAGIRLAIDDFGTGYSALGYLRRLPLDVLKIDRSWVFDAVGDRRTRHIVAGVVELAHQLGATVVMEGIEDAATAEMCRSVGADLGQGWLFGRPKPWGEATRELGLSAYQLGRP